MQLLLALLGCLFCALAALGVGAPLLRCLVNRETQERLQVGPMAMAASAFLLGQGVLGALWMGIGLVGWFTAPVVLASIVVPSICGAWMAWPWLRTAYYHAREWVGEEWATPLMWRLLFLATMLLILFYVLAAWVVTIPARSDGAAYYLPLAKCLIARGQLSPFPCQEHLYQMPLLGELHFAAMMFFGVEQKARLIATPTTLAGAVLLVALGARCGLGRRGQWMLLAIAWTSTTFTERLVDGKTDLFGFGMGVAAYYWVAVYRGRESVAALRLAGLFASLSVVAKLTLAASVLPGVALCAAWTSACREDLASTLQRGKAILASWFHLAFWGLLFVSANCVKNAVLYGEPLAPLYTFGSTHGWMYQTPYHSEAVALGILLFYPILLVFGHVRGQGGNLSILMLALAPLVILLPRPADWKRSPLLKVTCMAVVGILSYLIATHITSNAQVAPRYILPTLLLFALPVARAAEHVIAVERRPRLLVAALWCCLFAALLAAHRDKDLRRWVEQLGANLTQGQNLPKDPTIVALQELNRRATPGERLFSTSPTRLFLRSDLLQCINASADRMSGSNPQENWASIHACGFTWVLLDRQIRPHTVRQLGVREDGSASTPPWLEIECVVANKVCFLLRLKPAPEAPPPSVQTKEVRPGVWDVVRH